VSELILKATTRDVLGKKTRFLRRRGITPTHLFGHGVESMSLQCGTAELKDIIARGGSTRLVSLDIEAEKDPRSVFVREIQIDTITGQLIHVDLYQIQLTEKMTAEIPIILVGEAPAIKSRENILQQSLTHLGVACLPEKLPPQIEIDLSPLEEVNLAIYARDIDLGPDVTITTPDDQMIVKISQVAVEKEEEVVAELEAEEAEAEAEAAEGEGEAPAEEKPPEQ
jgi:large subunit ribosomal protein L25